MGGGRPPGNVSSKDEWAWHAKWHEHATAVAQRQLLPRTLIKTHAVEADRETVYPSYCQHPQGVPESCKSPAPNGLAGEHTWKVYLGRSKKCCLSSTLCTETTPANKQAAEVTDIWRTKRALAAKGECKSGRSQGNRIGSITVGRCCVNGKSSPLEKTRLTRGGASSKTFQPAPRVCKAANATHSKLAIHGPNGCTTATAKAQGVSIQPT